MKKRILIALVAAVSFAAPSYAQILGAGGNGDEFSASGTSAPGEFAVAGGGWKNQLPNDPKTDRPDVSKVPNDKNGNPVLHDDPRDPPGTLRNPGNIPSYYEPATKEVGKGKKKHTVKYWKKKGATKKKPFQMRDLFHLFATS